MVDLKGILSSLFPDVTIGENVDVEGDYTRAEVVVEGGLDVDGVRFGALPGETPLDVRRYEDGSELVIDPEKASDANWEDAKPALEGAWEETARYRSTPRTRSFRVFARTSPTST